MSGPVTLVYGDELMKHHLSDEHPLQPIRVKLTMELITSTGLIEQCHLVPPRAATIEELELVHSPEYVDLVQKLSDPALRKTVPRQRVIDAGFDSADNPISNHLHDGTALVAGASMVAAEAIASRTSTSTCTTATASRRASTASPTCSRSRCTRAAVFCSRAPAFPRTPATAPAAVRP